MIYFNDNDPFAAEAMRALIAEGLLPRGVVDDRSIEEISPSDLKGFEECHFFAGIGTWALALRLGGWSPGFGRSVWTGSCPCQPFSAVGRQRGHQDERHLWPAWSRLIRECRPDTIFGEQVSRTDGRAWIDVVSSELEDCAYAVGTLDLPAACFAPHRRQRLFWVADSLELRRHEGISKSGLHAKGPRGHDAPRRGSPGGVGDSTQKRRAALRQNLTQAEIWSGLKKRGIGASGSAPWSEVQWLECRDGTLRPTQPGLCVLANGSPARVGRLHSYGNAIVPQVAAAFINTYIRGKYAAGK